MEDLDIANERMIAGERLDCSLQRLRNRSYSSKLSTCSLNVSDAARSVRTWLRTRISIARSFPILRLSASRIVHPAAMADKRRPRKTPTSGQIYCSLMSPSNAQLVLDCQRRFEYSAECSLAQETSAGDPRQDVATQDSSMPCAANIAQDSEGFHVKPEHGSECREPRT